MLKPGEEIVISSLVGASYYSSVSYLLNNQKVTEATQKLLKNIVSEVASPEELIVYDNFINFCQLSSSIAFSFSFAWDKISKYLERDQVELMVIYESLISKLEKTRFNSFFHSNISRAKRMVA
ncbi:hypothetical protein KKC17_03810 [Patescibacteria group bacterium]|nr:hypothetical protein [Patescibacteria group bacterium]